MSSSSTLSYSWESDPNTDDLLANKRLCAAKAAADTPADCEPDGTMPLLSPIAPWNWLSGDESTMPATVVTAGRSKSHRKRRTGATVSLQPVGKNRRLGRPLNVLINPSDEVLATLPPVRQHFIVPESLNLGPKRQREPDSRTASCRCAHAECENRVAVSHAAFSTSLYMRCKWVTFLCVNHRSALDDGRPDRCSNCCLLTSQMEANGDSVLRIACLRQLEQYVLMINLCSACTSMPHVAHQLRAIRWAHAKVREIPN
jgi:hypothetical protein